MGMLIVILCVLLIITAPVIIIMNIRSQIKSGCCGQCKRCKSDCADRKNALEK